MNRPDPDIGEFGPAAEEYIAGDEIPDSLIEVLKHIAIDFVPETTAAVPYQSMAERKPGAIEHSG